MLDRQHFSLRLVTALVTVVTIVLTDAKLAFAQDETPSSAFAAIVKGVIVDPTTYAPALFGYDATMKDWNTSQPFFQSGFVEHNARFTVTGRPDDTAVSYTAGRRLILRDAFATFGMSAAQNATSRLVERALLSRYPEHRKAVKTIGWIERIAVASLVSYRLSADHYRQAQANTERALALGLR
jgi:hypothetical protein